MSITEVYSSKTVKITNFPKTIKRLRRGVKGGVSKLSRIAGIPRSTWYAIESGDIPRISTEVLEGIEKALGVDFGVVVCCDCGTSEDHNGSFKRVAPPPDQRSTGSTSDSTHVHQEKKGESEVAD